MRMSKSALDCYMTDSRLQAELERQTSRKVKLIVVLLVLAIPLAFISKAVPDKLSECYIYGLIGSYLAFFFYLILRRKLKCSKCGSRMRSVKVPGPGGDEQIFYVCENCKSKADSFYTIGD